MGSKVRNVGYKGAVGEANIAGDDAVQAAARAMLQLTVPEIRRLLWRLVWAVVPCAGFVLAWSRWRRRHQATAQFWHYKRRLNRPIQHLQP